MCIFILIFALTMEFPVEAKTIKSKIYSIDPSPGQGLPHLVLFENGSVVFLPDNDPKVLNYFKKNQKGNVNLILEVNDNHELRHVKGKILSETYRPSVLTSGSRSRSVFSRMRRGYRSESQCYNRAHVWAWEEFYYEGLMSRKQFLFFTTRYIRNYRHPWWFHVAPSVIVSGIGEQVLDPRYAKRPLNIRDWTKIFVTSGRTCPVVHRYGDYRYHQESEDCYLLPVPMYYWQPRDIEQRDLSGIEKKKFTGTDLDHAYDEAF